MTTPWLTTREDVRAALDAGDTPRNNRLVDAAIRAATTDVETLCRRSFRPTVATRYFPWPLPDRRSSTYRIWFDAHDLITATTVTTGDLTLTTDDYYLEPVNTGPPYTRLELNQGSASASFDVGSTFQRGISIAGLWGHSNVEETVGTLAAAITDTTGTTVTVSNAATVGVGDLLRVGAERLQVTDRGWAATGTTLAADLAALDSARSITVADGSTINPGEVLLIDSERVEVTDVVGDTVTAHRAVAGTVLAAHTNGATIYAARALTVERAAFGTTASAASLAATVWRHVAPAEATELAKAKAVVRVVRQRAGYVPSAGSGSGAAAIPSDEDLERMEALCRAALGRKARTR